MRDDEVEVLPVMGLRGEPVVGAKKRNSDTQAHGCSPCPTKRAVEPTELSCKVNQFVV